MRNVSIVLFLLVLIAIVIFAIENRGSVPITFLGMSLNAPMVLIVVSMYILGMITGGSFVSYLKRSYRRATDSR